jgi:hypothetical protein
MVLYLKISINFFMENPQTSISPKTFYYEKNISSSICYGVIAA